MKQKRCVELYVGLFLFTILKHIKLPAYDHSWSYSEFSNRPIPFELNRIESDGRFKFESNLEALEVPN